MTGVLISSILGVKNEILIKQMYQFSSNSLYYLRFRRRKMIWFVSIENLMVVMISMSRPIGVVVRGAGWNTKGPGFESRVRHGCQTVRPRPHQWLRSKTGKWEKPH